MAIVDIFVYLALIMLCLTLVFVVIAKKRMDRNEPVFGWKRKQYLEELQSDGSSNIKEQASSAGNKKVQKRTDQESILELMELKDIEYGVVARERNEHLVILRTDFVNFNLLQPSERVSILEGYQQLFSMINFPIQLLAQAVRQDFSKERFRFEQNLKKCNPLAAAYNNDVLDHIQQVTETDFRITLRIYYVVKYVYEPAKLAKLTKEQREQHILDNVGGRAEIVRRALGRAKVQAKILNSVEVAEVYKRALNRDRMVLNPIDNIVEEGKLSPYVTMDLSTIPGFEKFVNDVEEALEIVKVQEEGEVRNN